MENFKNIELKGYKWPKCGITDEHLERCKETAREFAKEIYDKINYSDALPILWEDTFLDWLLLNTKMNEEEAKRYMRRDASIIKRYGWVQYAWSTLPQGWWHFIEYIAQHYN